MSDSGGDRLRPWRPDEADRLSTIAAENPDLIRQLGPAVDVESARSLIEQWREEAERGRAWVWAVVTDEGPVGTVGVTDVNRRHRTGWCWYWLTHAARGRGLATAALASAAELAFQRGLHRLELAHRLDNPASCGVAHRAGFRPEGIERSKLEYDGVRHDCETHARLVDDPRPDIDLLPINRSSAIDPSARATEVGPAEEVEQCERAVWDALLTGDTNADRYVLSEDFVGLYPTGFATRADHIDQLAGGPTVAEYRLSEQRAIEIAADSILFCYRADYRRLADDTADGVADVEVETMYVSSLWCRREGRWRNVFSQDTPVGDPVV